MKTSRTADEFWKCLSVLESRSRYGICPICGAIFSVLDEVIDDDGKTLNWKSWAGLQTLAIRYFAPRPGQVQLFG